MINAKAVPIYISWYSLPPVFINFKHNKKDEDI